MGDQHTQASQQEHSEPARGEKQQPRARTHASSYLPPRLNVTAGGSEGPPLTRDNLLLLQRTVGNRAVNQLLQRRTKTRAAEESEAAAETPGPGAATTDEPKTVSVQAEEVEGEPAPVSPALASQLSSSKGGGQPLSEPDRGLFEATFRHDFGGVSLHTDAAADSFSRSLNARAFTTGRDIYFRGGEYQPGTSGGRELLSHELTHVVQQSSGPVAGTPVGGGISVSDPSDAYEQAAERTAETVMRQLPDASAESTAADSSAPASSNRAGASVQRDEAGSSSAPTAREMIDKHTSLLGNLDEEALGAELAGMLPGRHGFVYDVLQHLPDSDTDDVAQEIVINLGGRLAAVDVYLRVTFVWDMVYGTVTDSEEGVIAQIWESFGAQLPETAAAYPQIWAESVKESDQLNELPLIIAIRNGFENDVINLARSYLMENQREVLLEKKRLGIQGLFEDEEAESSAQPGYLEDIQAIAIQVAQLQKKLDELKTIRVGYNTEYDAEGMAWTSPANFNPESRPDSPPRGDESPPMADWETTKTQFDRVSAVISNFANLYPSIYALLRDEKLEELANAGDAAQAQAVIGESLNKVLEKISESNEKLSTEDIEYSDLVPIYTQLFNNSVQTDFGPRYRWEHPFYQMVAKDVLKDKEAHDFWTGLGLSLVAAAALIAAPFTGGATLVLLLGTGLGIGAYQAGAAWEKYDDLRTMGGAHVRDELALISKEQITAALVEAVLNTVTFFLDAFGAKAATTAAKTGARAAFEVEEQALKAELTREARKKMARGAMTDAAMEAGGAGFSVAQHELFGEEEPQIEAQAEAKEVQLPPDTPETPETADTSSTTVSRMVIQRQTGGAGTGGGGGVTPPTVPATVASSTPMTGPEFESFVSGALKRGEIRGLPAMDFVLPGQYTGSGWGIDRIGVYVNGTTGSVTVYHFEMKYTADTTLRPRELGSTRFGAQTGADWTENAVRKFIDHQSPEARAIRERLRRALRAMYPGRVIDKAVMEAFLHERLINAPVRIIVPHYADLSKLGRQIGGMVRHGRRAKIIKVHVP